MKVIITIENIDDGGTPYSNMIEAAWDIAARSPVIQNLRPGATSSGQTRNGVRWTTLVERE